MPSISLKFVLSKLFSEDLPKFNDTKVPDFMVVGYTI